MQTRFGHNLLPELKGPELPRPVGLVTSEKYQELVLNRLPFQPEVILVPAGASRSELDSLAAASGRALTMIAAGDGETAEAARYAAWKTGARLIVIPIGISAAQVSSRVTVKEKGMRTRVGEKPPDLLAVDYELIWKGPEPESRAAAGDLLAIVPALEDWRKAEPPAEPAFAPEVAEKAMALVVDLMDWADEIADLSESAIRKMFELFIAKEELARALGSRRPFEGPEAIFAAAVPALTGREFPPAALHCLGVVLMCELLGMTSRPLRQFLAWLRVAWKPEELGLAEPELVRALTDLPRFARDHGGADTIIARAELSAATIPELLAALRRPLLRSSLQDRKK